MNKIEQVARAISDNYGFRCSIGDNCPQCKMNDMEILGKAKAAIEAMREPTEAMINQEEVYWDYSCQICGGVKHQWQAMIDAALKEG